MQVLVVREGNMEKELREDKAEPYSIEIETSLENAIKLLLDLEKKHEGKLHLRLETNYDYSDSKSLYLVYDRLETDDEFYKRCKIRENYEMRERNDYERLKKKYG